ncbi:unnamed protein product, partial [Owenia fusiformis]
MEISGANLIILMSVAASYMDQVQNHLIQPDVKDKAPLTITKRNNGDSLNSILQIQSQNTKSDGIKRHYPHYDGHIFKERTKRPRVRRATRRGKKTKKAHIHVVPVMTSPFALSGTFDLKGNIQCNWTAQSRHNMKLYIDSPHKGSRGFTEAYIAVKHTGNYFIYGQVFFHAQNIEMGHCLYVADTYKRPCDSQLCRERRVMCSRSAPGHPEDAKRVENYNTN